MEKEDYIESLYSKIKVLNETLWEDRIQKSNIDQWLDNFKDDDEKLYALHLLSEFTYYGSTQMRQLLKSLYRDLYRYPLIEKIRKAKSNTIEKPIIEEAFKKVEICTRFFGVGNPSESGAHLLYFFRQENKLSKKLFVNTDEIFDTSTGILALKDPSLEYYVFIDDFCGTGSQVTTDTGLSKNISEIRRLKKDVHIFYLMLFGTSTGIKNLIDSKTFDHVGAVIEIDNTFKCFGDVSRYYDVANKFVDKTKAKQMAYIYGLPLFKDIIQRESFGKTDEEIEEIAKRHALGYRDCQLLFGFHHNTPDNTLPIIWYDENVIPWTPIFKRYNKKYTF